MGFLYRFRPVVPQCVTIFPLAILLETSVSDMTYSVPCCWFCKNHIKQLLRLFDEPHYLEHPQMFNMCKWCSNTLWRQTVIYSIPRTSGVQKVPSLQGSTALSFWSLKAPSSFELDCLEMPPLELQWADIRGSPLVAVSLHVICIFLQVHEPSEHCCRGQISNTSFKTVQHYENKTVTCIIYLSSNEQGILVIF